MSNERYRDYPDRLDLVICGTCSTRATLALIDRDEIPEHEEQEHPGCLDESPDCSGRIEYRMPLSGTGKSFPRCDHHWRLRCDLQERLNQRYPEQPPADWSPLDAGESWDEDY